MRLRSALVIALATLVTVTLAVGPPFGLSVAHATTQHTYYHHYTRGAVFVEEEIVADETNFPCELFTLNGTHATLSGGPLTGWHCQATFENESLVEILDD
jgi:hypothetical protein